MGFAKSLLHRAFGVPRGLLGRLGGRLMSSSAKREMATWVIGLLGVQRGDHVLEVGYGPGIGLELAAVAVGPSGFVAGIDPSEVMRQMALRRNNPASGRANLSILQASVDSIPLEPESFDHVFTMNSFQLWPDPAAGLKEIRRVIKPGGRLAISLDRFSGVSDPDAVVSALVVAGFQQPKVERNALGLCVLSRA